jgi:hypothetical protein
MPRCFRIWLVALLVLVTARISHGQTPAAVNSVLIVGMTPAALVDGVETEVEVTVAYEFSSHDRGLLEICSNHLRAQSMVPFASQELGRGTGTVTLKGKLTPRFWNNQVPAKISAMLVVAEGALTQRKSVASDQKKLTLSLRPGAPETQPKNPNPRDVYEDGIRIKSISPETFVADQPVELTVVVSYELLSREEGELGLGFSRGSAPGYSVSSQSKARVKIGKGEVTLRAMVTPRRTGSLPFGKVHVNLVEFPRRERTSVLASDAETVEVR